MTHKMRSSVIAPAYDVTDDVVNGDSGDIAITAVGTTVGTLTGVASESIGTAGTAGTAGAGSVPAALGCGAVGAPVSEGVTGGLS